MAAKDYSNSASQNTLLSDGTYIGPSMLRTKVRPALQQIAADLRDLYDTTIGLTANPASTPFQAAGTGAVSRTYLAKVRDTINVRDYGVVLDGSDETTKLQAALTAAAGGRLMVPAGTLGLTAVTVPSDTVIECSGTGTKFVPLDNTSTVFTFAGSNKMRNFNIEPATQRTGGKIFAFTGNFVKLSDFKATKCYKIADIASNNTAIWFDNFELRDNNNNGASELILVNTSGASIVITNFLADNNASLQPLAGVRVRNVADLIIDNWNVIHCGKNLLVDPPTGSVVASILGGKLFLDTAGTGLTLDTSGGGAIVRCAFNAVEASSHSGSGVVINATAGTINGVFIAYLESHLNGVDGITATGSNLSGLVIGNHRAAGNTLGAGLSMGASCTGIALERAAYGNYDGIGSANKYGLNLGTGAAVSVESGKIAGNTTANINGDTSGLALRNVTGQLTRNSGNNAIASSGTSVVITHGLAGTPGAADIKLTPTNSHGSNPVFVDTTLITSTTFTVKCGSAAATALNFAWDARCFGG